MASSEFAWFVKPYEGYFLSFWIFLRCFGPPGRREHSKHSEMSIVHSVAKILAQMSEWSLECTPEW